MAFKKVACRMLNKNKSLMKESRYEDHYIKDEQNGEEGFGLRD
jgi:hypothetical protein